MPSETCCSDTWAQDSHSPWHCLFKHLWPGLFLSGIRLLRNGLRRRGGNRRKEWGGSRWGQRRTWAWIWSQLGSDFRDIPGEPLECESYSTVLKQRGWPVQQPPPGVSHSVTLHCRDGAESGSCLAKDNSLEKEQLRAVSSQHSQQLGDGDTSW